MFSLFEANSAEILILSSITLVVAVLLATFRGGKKKLPPPKPSKPRQTKSPALQLPSLTAPDRDVLGRLSWILRSPGNLHKITSDEQTFLRAARLALNEGLATLDELRRLARRLGFDPSKLGEGQLSTLKLGSGVEISLADDQMHSGAGEISTNHPSALKVRLRSGYSSFTPGEKVDVICKGREGLYRFETTVQAQEGKKLLLDHTSDLERVQRRRHRRRDIRLPVELRVGGVALSSRTADISLGGAAVRNPQKRFGPGQEVRCSFAFADTSPMVIPAIIVRTSKNKSLLHLRFKQVEEGTRHRLFRSMLASVSK